MRSGVSYHHPRWVKLQVIEEGEAFLTEPPEPRYSGGQCQEWAIGTSYLRTLLPGNIEMAGAAADADIVLAFSVFEVVAFQADFIPNSIEMLIFKSQVS
jgi:hypothetical protein